MFKPIAKEIITIITVVAISYYVYAAFVLPAREAAMGMSCGSNLKQIGIGLLNYEYSYRSLPIAIETDKEGKLWRSWRSQIYPTFMEAFPRVYDEQSSWDSPSNMRLLNGTPIEMGSKDGSTYISAVKRIPTSFNCPSCRDNNREEVNYVVVIGELTAFPKSRSVKLSEITDGLENTLLVVESITCRPEWTEPRDLDFDKMSFVINSENGQSISSLHPHGPLVCFADSEVYHMSTSVTQDELRAMLTIAGNEDCIRDDLIKRRVLIPY